VIARPNPGKSAILAGNVSPSPWRFADEVFGMVVRVGMMNVAGAVLPRVG